MSAVAHPLGLDPLIAEAKRRARRRRLIAAGVVVLAGTFATAGVLSLGSGGSSGEIPWLPTRPYTGPANPPLAPPCTASQLGARLFLQGASMSFGGPISLVNRSSRRCSLVGPPRLSFAGATSRWQETSGSRSPVFPAHFDPLAPPRGTLRALAPGEHVSVSLWWSNWCGRGSKAGGDSGQPPSAIVLTPPGGGQLRLTNVSGGHGLPAPVCNGGPGSPSTLQVARYTPYVPEGPPSSELPLQARIVSGGPPLVLNGKRIKGPWFTARAGSWLAFTVVLTDRSRRPFHFGRTCPPYVEGFGADPRQAYILNCHAVGAIAPGRSVRFAMRVRVPAHPRESLPTLGWALAPHSWNAPEEPLAVVRIR